MSTLIGEKGRSEYTDSGTSLSYPIKKEWLRPDGDDIFLLDVTNLVSPMEEESKKLKPGDRVELNFGANEKQLAEVLGILVPATGQQKDAKWPNQIPIDLRLKFINTASETSQ